MEYETDFKFLNSLILYIQQLKSENNVLDLRQHTETGLNVMIALLLNYNSCATQSLMNIILTIAVTQKVVPAEARQPKL